MPKNTKRSLRYPSYANVTDNGEVIVRDISRNDHVRVSDEQTRPANTTPYAAADVIGDGAPGVLSLGDATKYGQSGVIKGIRLTADDPAMAEVIKVHIFNAAPTSIADNAQNTLLYADIAKKVATVTLPATATGGTGSTASAAEKMDLNIPFTLGAASASLYYVLEAGDAYTPISEGKFKLEAFITPTE